MEGGMNKHTPGPWIYGPETGPDCTRIDAENGRVIAAVRSREITSFEQSRPIYSWSEEGAANASLIAAAPELLAALQLYLAHASEPECAIWRHVQQKASAAIAKATGEQP